MKTAFPRVCLASLVFAGLTGCASTSGGAGGIAPAVPANFTSWGSSRGSGQTLVATGDSQQGTYTFNLGTGRVTARTVGPQQTGVTYTEIWTTSTPVLSTVWARDVRLQTASGTDIRFNRVDDTFFDSTDTAGSLFQRLTGIESGNGQNFLVIADPQGPNTFVYQTYGIWATGVGTGSGTYGAISVGSPTPAGVIPTEGLATYTGNAAGRHVALDGSLSYTVADMTTAADFFRRELTFTTTFTRQMNNVVAGTSTSNPALNMTGILNIVAGTNQFSGPVSAGGMTGTATGRFYGPAAQEIGGTFSVTGTGVQSYSGAFGGKKP